jgi:replicative DNA helicase
MWGLLSTARVLRGDTGSEVTVEEMFSTGERPLVWSLDERQRMVVCPVADVIPRGTQEAFLLRLASGRQLEVTADQSFMTLAGLTPLRELMVDDRVA